MCVCVCGVPVFVCVHCLLCVCGSLCVLLCVGESLGVSFKCNESLFFASRLLMMMNC